MLNKLNPSYPWFFLDENSDAGGNPGGSGDGAGDKPKPDTLTLTQDELNSKMADRAKRAASARAA